MKTILSILLTAGIGYISHQHMPWWFVVVVAALVAAGMNLKSASSFLAGFLGLALLWGLYAAFINAGNDGILANRIGALLGNLNGMTMVLLTALLAGLIGGLGALTGSLGRQLIN